MIEPMNRSEKIAAQIAEHAAQFFERESNRQSLITVTHASLSADSATATIYISVLPQSAEEAVLSFVRRNRTELRRSLQKRIPAARIPTVDVVIDQGEKHRQHIDELLRN